jgi:hypothetical protein
MVESYSGHDRRFGTSNSPQETKHTIREATVSQMSCNPRVGHFRCLSNPGFPLGKPQVVKSVRGRHRQRLSTEADREWLLTLFRGPDIEMDSVSECSICGFAAVVMSPVLLLPMARKPAVIVQQGAQ